MEAGEFYTFGEDTEQTKSVLLCYSGLKRGEHLIFYIMERSKAVNAAYFLPSMVQKYLRNGRLKAAGYRTTNTDTGEATRQ